VRKASFAPAALTREATGMEIGGVTPFGLPPDLPLWIDQRIADLDRVIVGGGSRSIKLLGHAGRARRGRRRVRHGPRGAVVTVRSHPHRPSAPNETRTNETRTWSSPR
jgi:hypothetical protein